MPPTTHSWVIGCLYAASTLSLLVAIIHVIVGLIFTAFPTKESRSPTTILVDSAWYFIIAIVLYGVGQGVESYQQTRTQTQTQIQPQPQPQQTQNPMIVVVA